MSAYSILRTLARSTHFHSESEFRGVMDEIDDLEGVPHAIKDHPPRVPEYVQPTADPSVTGQLQQLTATVNALLAVIAQGGVAVAQPPGATPENPLAGQPQTAQAPQVVTHPAPVPAAGVLPGDPVPAVPAFVPGDPELGIPDMVATVPGAGVSSTPAPIPDPFQAIPADQARVVPTVPSAVAAQIPDPVPAGDAASTPPLSEPPI